MERTLASILPLPMKSTPLILMFNSIYFLFFFFLICISCLPLYFISFYLGLLILVKVYVEKFIEYFGLLVL